MAVNPITMAALVLIYLAATLIIGYMGYKKTKNAEDYLVAGRNSHPVIIALSYGATFISTSAIIGFGRAAANMGMGLIRLTVLNIGLGILLAFVLFGKKTREISQRLSAVTFPDLMCKLYKSPLLQYIAGFIIVISMPLYTAAILIGGALLRSPWTAVDPIVIALPISLVVMILMQWQSGKQRPATVAAESTP
jgi:SSS family solute:Na+ symporter